MDKFYVLMYKGPLAEYPCDRRGLVTRPDTSPWIEFSPTPIESWIHTHDEYGRYYVLGIYING